MDAAFFRRSSSGWRDRFPAVWKKRARSRDRENGQRPEMGRRSRAGRGGAGIRRPSGVEASIKPRSMNSTPTVLAEIWTRLAARLSLNDPAPACDTRCEFSGHCRCLLVKPTSPHFRSPFWKGNVRHLRSAHERIFAANHCQRAYQLTRTTGDRSRIARGSHADRVLLIGRQHVGKDRTPKGARERRGRISSARSRTARSRETHHPLERVEKRVGCPLTPQSFALAPRSGERVRERGDRQRANGGPLSPPSPRCAGRGRTLAAAQGGGPRRPLRRRDRLGGVAPSGPKSDSAR